MRIKTSTGITNSQSLAKQIVNWRYKGHDVSQVTHPEDLMQLAGLDWKVELQQVKTENGTPTPWCQAVKVGNDA